MYFFETAGRYDGEWLIYKEVTKYMKIITVIEDTCGRPDCVYEHGLCIYVETDRHRLLVDTGATGAILDNARVLGIDLTRVDTVILSHGHYDHAGGILPFAGINPHAQIFMKDTAADGYYHGERYIGIDQRIPALPQVHMIEGDMKLDDELSLFSGIRGRRLWPQGNLVLTRRADDDEIRDDFSHEQCLVITRGDRRILISGCAHNGILNILDRFRELYGCLPQAVISGFHMMKKNGYTEDDIRSIKETAEELRRLDTVFYTGHCTGQFAFDIMKTAMGDQLIQLHSGMVLETV